MLVSQKLDSNDGFTVADSVEHLNIKWHLGREFLGVSSFIPGKGGFLSFYTKKGGKPFYLSTIQNKQFPNCIDWHPSETLLAVGWESGKIELVDPNQKTEIEIIDAGLDKVCCIKWNEFGSILLAMDLSGLIKVFQFDFPRQKLLQPKHLSSAQIIDEIPTDVCPKLFDRKILDYSATLDKRINRTTSASQKMAKLAESNGKDELAELLNKHKRFMEFEEEKQMISAKQTVNVNYVTVFLIATNKGGVHLFDPASGQLFRIFQADSSIRQLLDVLPDKSVYVLAISEGMMFYELSFEGRLANDKIKVKLSGRPDCFSMIRIDSGLVVLCYGEREIRIWDLENEDSAILTLSTEKGYDISDQIVCLSYSSKKDTISGATASGKVASWRRQQKTGGEIGRNKEVLPIDQQWRLQNALSLNSPYAVVQVSPQILSLIKITDPIETQELQLHTNIRGFYITGNYLLLWDQSKVQLDQIIYSNDSPLRIQTLSSFDIPVISTAIFYNQQIYIIEKNKLLINTIQGTLKKSVIFREIEGNPGGIDVNGKWICVAMTNGYLRIYDLSDDNFKLVFHSSHVGKSVTEFLSFASIKINCAGNRVSFTVQRVYPYLQGNINSG